MMDFEEMAAWAVSLMSLGLLVVLMFGGYVP